MKICKIFLVLLLMAPLSAFAEIVTVGVQVGWSVPQGDAFKFGDESTKGTKGGLNVDADILYHFSLLGGGRLAAGITYNGSFLFGASVADVKSIDFYSHRMYGLKARFNLLPGIVPVISPYIALSAGFARLSVPAISASLENGFEAKAERANSFGLRPEIGVQLSKFSVSAGYIIPTNYSFDSRGTKNAGILQISLGMRLP